MCTPKLIINLLFLELFLFFIFLIYDWLILFFFLFKHIVHIKLIIRLFFSYISTDSIEFWSNLLIKKNISKEMFKTLIDITFSMGVNLKSINHFSYIVPPCSGKETLIERMPFKDKSDISNILFKFNVFKIKSCISGL